jgi:hypothetical protein
VRLLPDGRRRTLAGQSYDLVPGAIVPVLEEFLSG